MADSVITDKEYIYLTIPTKYICIYHQLCELMVDYGEDMLKDCKADCNNKNIEVVRCFNMFNAALLARELGKTKHEETLIKYITAKLKQLKHNTCKSFTIQLEDNVIGLVECTKDGPVIKIDSEGNDVPDPEPKPEQPENQSKILYLTIKPTDYINYINHQEYAIKHIINDNIQSINEINSRNLSNSYTCNLDEPKLMFVVLVPENLSLSVKLDDGFGNKVMFGSSNLWYSNGEVKVTMNNVNYKVYGELYIISSNVKFYIS